MILNEFISYKTFYYFLKDDSNLNLEDYVDETSKFDDFINNGYQAEDFYKIYQPIKTGTNDIIILKTKYGSIVFHLYDKHEHVKKFLIENSKNKPCAVFGSHRVSDTYQIGIAKNSELERYLFYSDDEHILEGKQTDYEKKNNIEYRLGEDGFFTDFLDEDDVYEYAQDFFGFDIYEDVEILDFKYYKFEPFAFEEDIDDCIDDDIIFKIHENIKKQGLNDAAFYFTKYENENMCDCSCVLKMEGKNYFIFSKSIDNIDNKNDFKSLFNSCLKALATKTFKNYAKSTLSYAIHAKMMEEFKYSSCMAMIDNEEMGVLSMSRTVLDGDRESIVAVDRNMLTIKRFKPKKFKLVHKYILKKLP